jgi:serine/threonine-protein kinase
MPYCPECGEVIAKEDIFCPFCGISIKPIVPVEDSSMSETIVGVPSPIALNDENLEASIVKSEAETPKIEAQTETAAEDQKAAKPAKTSENALGFTAGNTSENWAMKTESVEIPAENLEDIRSIPLPKPFGEEEPSPAAAEEKAPEIGVTPPSAFSIEEPEISQPAEKSEALENVSEIPAPAIIQTPELEFKSEEPVFEPLPAPEELPEKAEVSESVEFEKKAETPLAGEVFPPLPEPFAENAEKIGNVLTGMPADLAGSKKSADIFEPVIDASKELPETTAPPEEKPAAEVIEPIPAVAEPPIGMPDLPLAFENKDESARYDSVQIIQKDEIEEEKAIHAPVVRESAAEEPPSESKDARSSTTPNFVNSDTDGRKAAKLKPLDEGTILNGRYEIVRKIGGGGMGAVYLATDRNLGGVLRAVKEMVQSYIESEQQDKAINDFKRESLLLTSLDHPAIPTIFDYFFDEKEGRFYLVMKYISGGDLAGRLRAAPEGRIDEKSVTEWAIQIADVLDYLHNHEPSIVYRDLKPANVMIDSNTGRVMLIDFGIARWVNKEEKGVTAVGTMGYAPPELFSGNVEARSDIYSLGSTMFHLLTGADPQSNPLLIFDFQKNPRPRQINSQLSDQIEQILMRSVEYNAEARFTSAAELRDALKEHFNNLQMGKVTYGVKVAPSNRAFSEQAVFCGFCGKQIVATDVFCAFCGAQQPIAQQGVSQPSVAVQPLTAKLVIQGTGELEPSSFRLEKSDNLLGRRDPMSNIFPEVDLSKYDPQTKISRRHARIWREGNSFLVEDLGSSNGTTLLPSASDSVRLLPHQPHTLTNGDKIKLGDTTLHFTIG